MNDIQKFTDVMYWCLIVVNEHGYYTTDNALIYSTKSTSDRVHALLGGDIDKDSVEYDDAIKMQEWLLEDGIHEDTKFHQTILSFIHHGVIGNSTSMIASLISPYYTYLYNEIRRKRLIDMTFTGGYLSKTLFRLKTTVTFLNSMKPKFINSKARTYNFISDSGNRIEWNGTLPRGVKLKLNAKYSLNGIVKSHEERDGIDTTVMTKCKLSKI